MDFEKIKNSSIETIKKETEAIHKLIHCIDDEFAKVVELIFNSKGRVIITGIGKSAHIAGKIVATMNSTGTPAIFMHAADAIHGDLGIIQKNDVVICISKSGNTPEVKVLVPLIKKFKNTLIGMVSNADSYLAKNADFIIKTTVSEEACPNNLAPTTSTTAQLVMGDALAICLLEMKGFTSSDFAKVHPGGSLGKKLYTRVADIYTFENPPKVAPGASIREVIIEISSKRLGATAVVEDSKVKGIITDGDLRRMLEKHEGFESLKAKDIMSSNPKVIDKNEMAIRAFNLMENNNITQLIVVNNASYAGIIHIHDILSEGIV